MYGMTKKLGLPLAALGAALFAAVPAVARDVPIGQETYIAFPNQSSIRTFRTIDRDTIYFQDRQRRWYRGEVIGPCFDLPFAQAIGFDVRGTSRLDRFSTLLVRGQRCQLSSLVRSEAPPTRKELRRMRREERGSQPS